MHLKKRHVKAVRLMPTPVSSHINMQVVSQRPGCSDGLSNARANFIGSSVRELCSHSSEDPRPVNHPVAIDDGDATLGLQSWRKIQSASITLVNVMLKIFLLLDTVCGFVCVFVCIGVCTQVVSAFYGLLYADVACSCRNICNLMVVNTEESPREIPLHHLKPLPTHTFTHFYARKATETCCLSTLMYRHTT